MEIRFHKEALADITDSYDYYNKQQKGLGDRFILEVEKKLEVIKSFPLRARIVYNSFRQVNIKVFPFLIVYTYIKVSKEFLLVPFITQVKILPGNLENSDHHEPRLPRSYPC
jgi:hypothetical protein